MPGIGGLHALADITGDERDDCPDALGSARVCCASAQGIGADGWLNRNQAPGAPLPRPAVQQCP
jgi:hypothetical protein